MSTEAPRPWLPGSSRAVHGDGPQQGEDGTRNPSSPEQLDLLGQPAIVFNPRRYVGPSPTATERASGEAIAQRERGPLKAGSAGHQVLTVYADGERRTSYDASMSATGDWHASRRESTRLMERGYLEKDGTMPNRSPKGRKHVDAYRITPAGRMALGDLDREWDKA